MPSDPVTGLIEALNTSPKADAGVDAADNLSQVAELIPDRSPTQVPDVNASRVLELFQRQRRSGLIEVAVVEGLFDLVRQLLILKGVGL